MRRAVIVAPDLAVGLEIGDEAVERFLRIDGPDRLFDAIPVEPGLRQRWIVLLAEDHLGAIFELEHGLLRRLFLQPESVIGEELRGFVEIVDAVDRFRDAQNSHGYPFGIAAVPGRPSSPAG